MFKAWLTRLSIMDNALRIRRRGDPELAQLPALFSPAQTAVDVGANRGVYTWWLRRHAAQVHAFEPNPQLAARLGRCRYANVKVHNLALSGTDGRATLQVPRHRKGGWNDPAGMIVVVAGQPAALQDCRQFEVATARLDDQALGAVGFIKIDVEGHEEQVLDGAWGTIVAQRPAILIELEERHSPGTLGRAQMRFSGIGMSLFYLDQRAWNPAGQLDSEQRTAGGNYINNFLIWPDENSLPRVV